MARQVVGNPFDNQIPTVSPTAEIVDTYYRPTPERAPLAGIAETLQKFNSKAKPILQRMENRAIERDIAEGQRLYNENRINIGEAVKQGIIEEGESPYLRKGYRIAQLNTLSMRYTAELESALERQKLYTNGNPDKIEKFIGEFQNQFMQKNGLDKFGSGEVTQYFGTSATKSNELFRETWRKKHVSWQREQNYIAFQGEVAEATINLFQPDMSLEERQAAMGSFAQWLEGRAADANIDGMKNSDVLNTILQGVGLAVEQTGQTDILDVFKSTKFGTAAAASSLKVQSELLKIEQRAIQLEEANARREEKKLNEAFESARATTRSIADDFYQDPTGENRKALMAGIDSLLATPDDKNTSLAIALRKELTAYERAEALGGTKKTPNTELDLDADLQAAKTYEEATTVLERAAERGEVTPTDVTSRLNQWRTQFDPALDEQFGLNFNTSTTTEGRAQQEIYAIVRGNEYDYKSSQLIRARVEQQKFRSQLRNGVAIFIEENGRPPQPYELDDIAFNIQQTIVDRLMEDGVLDPLEEADNK